MEIEIQYSLFRETNKHSAFYIYWFLSQKLKFLMRKNSNSHSFKKRDFVQSQKLLENEKLDLILKKLSDPNLNWKTTTREGSYRKLEIFNDPDCDVCHFDEVWNIFSKEEILDLAETHFGKILRDYYKAEYRILNVSSYITKKSKEGVVENSFLWHIDDHPPGLIKGFLYLTDTSVENGPFTFISKTHRINHFPHQDKTQKTDCRFDETYVKSLGIEPTFVTGEVGSSFLVNANCIHRGSPVKEGYRQVLSFKFLPSIQSCSEHYDLFGTVDSMSHPDRIHVPIWNRES